MDAWSLSVEALLRGDKGVHLELGREPDAPSFPQLEPAAGAVAWVHGSHASPPLPDLPGGEAFRAPEEAPMALESGKKAPDFKLADDDGTTVRLSDFKGKRVVLFFFPKADTPG